MDRAPLFILFEAPAVQFSTVIQSFRIYPKEGLEEYWFSVKPSFRSMVSDALSGFTPD